MPRFDKSNQIGMSSSLDQIHIAPRTPKSTRSYGDSENGHLGDELELNLLGDEERRQAAMGLEEADGFQARDKVSVSLEDKKTLEDSKRNIHSTATVACGKYDLLRSHRVFRADING